AFVGDELVRVVALAGAGQGGGAGGVVTVRRRQPRACGEGVGVEGGGGGVTGPARVLRQGGQPAPLKRAGGRGLARAGGRPQGVQFDQLLEALDGLLGLLAKRAAVGEERRGAAECLPRLLELPLIVQGNSKAEVRLGIIRLHPDGYAEGRLRLLVLALVVVQGGSQVVV